MIRSFSDVFDCCKRGLRQVLLDNELFTKHVVEAPVSINVSLLFRRYSCE